MSCDCKGKKVVRKINVADVESDKTLKPEEGWIDMNVKWIMTEKTGAKDLVFGRTILKPGSTHELHYHDNVEEVMYMESGYSTAVSGNETFTVGPGDVVIFPKGDKHTVWNDTQEDSVHIWVYCGAPSLEKAGYHPVAEEQCGK